MSFSLSKSTYFFQNPSGKLFFLLIREGCGYYLVSNDCLPNHYLVSNGLVKQTIMLSTRTQTAIAVLHDLSSGGILQSANFLLSEGEWKDLFNELARGHLIRLLPDKKPGILFSYELCSPLSDISLLNVLEAMDEPIRCNMPTPELFYIRHSQMANKIGILNQVARTFLADIKIIDW